MQGKWNIPTEYDKKQKAKSKNVTITSSKRTQSFSLRAVMIAQ